MESFCIEKLLNNYLRLILVDKFGEFAGKLYENPIDNYLHLSYSDIVKKFPNVEEIYIKKYLAILYSYGVLGKFSHCDKICYAFKNDKILQLMYYPMYFDVIDQIYQKKSQFFKDFLIYGNNYLLKIDNNTYKNSLEKMEFINVLIQEKFLLYNEIQYDMLKPVNIPKPLYYCNHVKFSMYFRMRIIFKEITSKLQLDKITTGIIETILFNNKNEFKSHTNPVSVNDIYKYLKKSCACTIDDISEITEELSDKFEYFVKINSVNNGTYCIDQGKYFLNSFYQHFTDIVNFKFDIDCKRVMDCVYFNPFLTAKSIGKKLLMKTQFAQLNLNKLFCKNYVLFENYDTESKKIGSVYYVDSYYLIQKIKCLILTNLYNLFVKINQKKEEMRYTIEKAEKIEKYISRLKLRQIDQVPDEKEIKSIRKGLSGIEVDKLKTLDLLVKKYEISKIKLLNHLITIESYLLFNEPFHV